MELNMKKSISFVGAILISICLTSCDDFLGVEDNPVNNAQTPTISDNSEIIEFKDKNVEGILVQYFDRNLDYKLSKAEALLVFDLGRIFQENDYITSFDELQYFTRLTNLREKTFYRNLKLKSITIPGSVEIVGRIAFDGTGLEEVTIMDGVKEIQFAFSNCNSLKKFVIYCKTPPILSENRFITNEDITIYVPKESLNAYKTADKWSNLSDKIKAME